MGNNKKASTASEKQMRQVIAESLQLSRLAKSQQEKVLATLMEAISLRIQAAVLSRLSREQVEKLKKMGKVSDKKTLAFLEKNIKDFPGLTEKIASKTIGEFRAHRARKS